MEWINALVENTEWPVISAFALGLLTAISPCPLATNIAAVGYVGKDITEKKTVFIKGLLYVLGRIIAYTLLGAVLIFIIRQGAETFDIQKSVSKYGELLMPPALIIFGLLMLFSDKLSLPSFGISQDRASALSGKGGCLLLGILLALAFCPSSALFYFGMLIPSAAADTHGYLMLVSYAVATGLPVAIVAWILAYSVGSISTFYSKMKSVQKWLNISVALIFIAVGSYYLLLNIGVL